jgi:hypothetical protein
MQLYKQQLEGLVVLQIICAKTRLAGFQQTKQHFSEFVH